MIFVSLLFVIFVGIMLNEGENPLATGVGWIWGGIVAFYWVARWRRRQKAGSPSITSPVETRSGAEPELDMFNGLRDWKDGECPPEVATAMCSLSWRDPAYLRSLLVMATLRGDGAGGTVAGAARRLLQPAAKA
jgi:hypothetical protein